MQEFFGRSSREAWGMKRSGNRSQTFGTGSGNFCRNCPNREQELAGFFREISRMQDDIHSSRKLAAALIAGLIAMVVQTAMIETPPLLTSRPDWAAFIASLFALAPREKPRWNPS
jgi:hypothetical protein